MKYGTLKRILGHGIGSALTKKEHGKKYNGHHAIAIEIIAILTKL